MAARKKSCEADLAEELFMLEVAKGFGEDVTQLVHRSDELKIDHASVCTLLDIRVVDVNVLRPIVMHWILDQGDG